MWFLKSIENTQKPSHPYYSSCNHKSNYVSYKKIDSIHTENKYMMIKELTDRFKNVVTRAGTEEFQKHYNYFLYLITAIEQNNYTSIYDNSKGQLNSPTHLNGESNRLSILNNANLIIPLVKNRRVRTKGRKPFNCFSKTKSQIISSGISKKYKKEKMFNKQQSFPNKNWC